jgi:hypothetical protein
MPVFNTFSKRQRERPATFAYDVVPDSLRLQLRIVLEDAFGSWAKGWEFLGRVMEREHAAPSFNRQYESRLAAAAPYAIQCLVLGTFEESIDAIETGLRILNIAGRKEVPQYHGIRQSPDDAVAEVNERFLEHGIGYQFSVEENQIVRLDSALLHKEAVEPAMRLLGSPGFEGPADEFAKAHAYHRSGDGKDAVSWAVKALESAAKAICNARGWSYDKATGPKDLIDVIYKNGLIPQELEAYFGGLRTALVSGLPTIGNRMTRHGQGPHVKPIAEHMVTFGMHLAAATIVFLVEAHRAQP